MTRRRVLFSAGAVILVAGAAIGWWLVSPLFIDNVVDEAFPFEMPDQTELASMTADEIVELESDFAAAMPSEKTLESLSDDDRQTVQEKVMTVAAEMPDHPMDDSAPEEAGPQPLLTGNFTGADEFHRGSGVAAIFRVAGDRRILRFEDFNVTNGPALSVLLSPNPSPATSRDLGAYIDLGPLKGNIGNQNYEISPATNLDEFKSVVIYCVPFKVVFAVATLAAP